MKGIRRFGVRVLLAGSMVLGSMAIEDNVVSANASAQNPAPGAQPAVDVPDSNTLTGAPMLSGVLVGGNGKPVPDAWLIVVAWPNSAELAALKDGSEVPVRTVAKARTDAHGAFKLRPINVESLRRFADDAGNVNLEVRSIGTADFFAWSFPRRIIGRGGSAVLLGPEHGDPKVEAAAARGVAAAFADVTLTPVGTTASEGIEVDPNQTEIMKEDPPFTDCGYPTKVSDYAPSWDVVGQVYSSATSGYVNSFVHNTGATSTLGVGASFTGAYGSFSVNGSHYQSTSVATTFPGLTGSGGRYFKTQFIYSKFVWHCAAYRPNIYGVIVWTVWDEYRVKPTSHAGGATTTSVSAISATYCTPYSAGTGTTIDYSSAVTWSNGVAISGQIGINLSSQTGYNTNTKVGFIFTASRKLCGSNGYPGSAPRQLKVTN